MCAEREQHTPLHNNCSSYRKARMSAELRDMLSKKGACLDLAVVRATRKEPAVRRIRQRARLLEVPLLLQHVRLAAPLPHEELPQRGAAEGHPGTGGAKGGGRDGGARN